MRGGSTTRHELIREDSKFRRSGSLCKFSQSARPPTLVEFGLREDPGPESTTRRPMAWEVIRHPIMVAAIAVLSVKLVLFAIDRLPLFYMGDSRAYVYSAIWGEPALDRSNTYGRLIWAISVLPKTLTTLVLAQTLAGAVTAWLLAVCLLRFFKVRPVLAIAAAVAFAFEPLQVLHERMVLTESFAMLVLAIYVSFGLFYLTRPRALTLIALAATGVLLLSLRLVYIPVTLVGAVLIPLLAWAIPNSERAESSVRRFLAHLMLSLFVTFGFHQAYKTVTGLSANLPPAYQYTDGLFLAAAWAPLIEPEDAVDARARRVVEELLATAPASFRNFDTRYRQLWGEDGLTRKMITAFGGDAYSANVAAQQMSRRILRRAPLSVVRVTALTYGRYWQSPATMYIALLDEQGTARGPEPRFGVVLKQWFNLDAAETQTTMTPSKRYHLRGPIWYIVLLVSPLIGLLSIPWSRKEARPGALLITVLGATLLLVTCATGVAAVFRYLHPLVFGTLVALAVIADGVSRRFTKTRIS